MYHIRCTYNAESLLSNVDAWNRLAGGWPYRESSWLGKWWQCFGNRAVAYFVTASDSNGNIKGILPLYFDASTRTRTLRFVGQGLACSDNLSILCDAGDATEIGCAMGRWLCEQTDAPEHFWNRIDLDGVIAGDEAMRALIQALRDGGVLCDLSSRMHSWFLPTCETWDAFLSRLGKSTRRMVRNANQRLTVGDDNKESSQLELRFSNDIPQVQSHLRKLMELHQRRWQRVGQQGSFADPRFAEFVIEAAIDFFHRDRLKLASLWHHETMIAGSLQLMTGDGCMTIYSTGVDMDYAHLQPGNVMNAATIRRAIDLASPGIDYLRGDEPYKAQLTAQPRRVVRIQATPATLRGRLERTARSGAFELAQWLRRQRGTTPITVLPSLDLPPASLDLPTAASLPISPQC